MLSASGIIASSLESGSFSCVPNRELLSKYRILLLSLIYVLVEMVRMFEEGLNGVNR